MLIGAQMRQASPPQYSSIKGGACPKIDGSRRLIKVGLGFGPLPIHVVAADIDAGQLWQLPPYDDPPAADVYLVTRPVARRSLAETLMIERLLAAIEAVPLSQRTYPQNLAAAELGRG